MRLITLAIHTYDRACRLKSLLEQEGVDVVLQNVNLTNPEVATGVRVRISDEDLPLALRIIENPDIFHSSEQPNLSPTPASHTLLMPIDFSERSLNAAVLAFDIAARHNAKVVFLHSYIVPEMGSLISIAPSLTFDSEMQAEEQQKSSVAIACEARQRMQTFTDSIKQAIKSGKMAAVKYASVLMEGLPEECVARYVKEHHEVRLIVMTTRPAEQKSNDLAGSIAAEVLDSCRLQALTMPGCCVERTKTLTDIHRVALLSSLEQEDFLALDALNRLMPAGQALDIKVLCLPDKKYLHSTTDAARRGLIDYCRTHYPQYGFSIANFTLNSTELSSTDFDLLVVPNRKKNMLMRLFNPGLAHRILFHTDVPMISIPV